jgi:integrase
MRGHVARRGKTWSYVIDVAPDPATGRRRQRSKGGFLTKGAAEDAMREAIARGSSSGKGSQRLGDYLAEWIVTVRPRLRETTFNGYQMAVDRVTAGLGAVRMDDLTPLAIERFYAELLKTGGRREQGLSAKSVGNTHVALRKALADAERLELINRNPAARARPPRGERVEIVTWTSAQVAQFLRGVADDPMFALWVLLATTGLRRGEALGLRWKDVDLERATLSVSQTITAVQHGVIVSPPKSDRSRRRLGLDPDTVRVLSDHQQAQQRDRELLGLGPARLVFCTPEGEPLHPDAVTRRFKTLVRWSGLPMLRGPHDLRHTWASLALAAGVHPKVVSDRLGHSTIAITIDTYSHAIPSLDADAAAIVASQLFGNSAE